MHSRRGRQLSNTRWSYATPNQTAAAVVALPGGLFVEYGAPALLLSDIGSKFLSGVTTELLRSEDGNHDLASRCHAQTDGKNENSHKRALSQMRPLTTDNPRD